MEYSSLYTSGLRVMAQNQSDRESVRSSSSKSFRTFLLLDCEPNRAEPGNRGQGRITSLPGRLFKRTKLTKQPKAASGGSYSVPSSRNNSLDINVWAPPSKDTFSTASSTLVPGYDHDADDDAESLWHARTLLKSSGSVQSSHPYSMQPPSTPTSR